jgi:antitoxin component HigA of HigAB toxin-antitoxin module
VDPIYATVSRNVRILMAERGLTQATLADDTGLRPDALSLSLRGKRKWHLDDLSVLANYFDIPAQLLLEDTIVRNRCFRLGSLIAA